MVHPFAKGVAIDICSHTLVETHSGNYINFIINLYKQPDKLRYAATKFDTIIRDQCLSF